MTKYKSVSFQELNMKRRSIHFVAKFIFGNFSSTKLEYQHQVKLQNFDFQKQMEGWCHVQY